MQGPRGAAHNYRTHRIAYAATNGQIPDCVLVRHTCDNPPCCNPTHLVLGSPRDNTHDALERGRLARGERQGLARLTEQQVREIRRLHGPDNGTIRLGQTYGVSPATISQIIRRVTWRHV